MPSTLWDPFSRSKWKITKEGDLVRVPEAWLGTVVFLGVRGVDDPAGSTAFFMQINNREIRPGVDFETGHLYLVTAAHCVRDEVGIFALINDPGGGVSQFDLPDGKEWSYHPDAENVDLAVLPLTIETAVFFVRAGYGFLQESTLFDEADLRRDIGNDGYGIADELVAVGLFHVHVGEDRTLPLVRSGNLAMVPREPVTVKDEGTDRITREWLYLAELRSIGGMSGSPVFGVYRYQIGEETVPFRLLGVLLGHWNARGSKTPIQEGIAMVAPARMLREVLYQEGLMARRKKENEEEREQSSEATAVRDRTPKKFTKAEFDEALKKVTEPIDKPAQSG